MNKELLILKKIYRKTLPDNNQEIGKTLLNIFSVKYSISANDFQRKQSTCVNLSTHLNDSQCINECPLSDKQLLPIFNSGSGIVRIIYKLLLEISDETPSVTYAPLLFPLVSFLCIYLNEIEIKNIVITILSDIDMVPSSTTDWNVYCHLLTGLGRKYGTKAHRSLYSGSKTHIRQLYFWPYALFSMPLIFIRRVLTCYFIEGGKVLIRAGLLLWKETYRRRTSPGVSFDWKEELMSTATNIAQTYTPQTFLDRMFKIRNFSHLNITRCKRSLAEILDCGEWISPTASKTYIAFKTKDANPSAILTHNELIDIIQNLNPYLAQLNKPVPLFLSSKHGYSLRTLYNIAEESSATLLIIETALGEVIGAFCADAWSLKNRQEIHRFYGKGECFIFKIRPSPMTLYRWNQDRENILANMFQKATLESLEVGGGRGGAAISVNNDLSRGKSSYSSTFDSPCLTQFSNDEFMIKSLELLAFEETH